MRPSRSSELAASLTAIGEAEASTMLAGPKRIAAASSGSSRGPGSQLDDPVEHRLVDHRHERDEHGARA